MARSLPAGSRRSGRSSGSRWALVALLGALATTLLSASAQAQDATPPAKAAGDQETLRVCADPNNLPQSNQAGEGYENKIAEALASDLGRRVEYTYFPQRMGFVRNTLRARDQQTQQFKCDVIIGVPKGYELTATTRPYMHSTYALVFRQRPELDGLKTANDLLQLPPEKLQALKIGVFGRSPGADWLLQNGLIDSAIVYPPQSGDPAENPARIIDTDLSAGKIDVAIVWGPVAGFLINHHAGETPWRAVPFETDPKIKFDYEIAMGVRFGEKEWKEQLDQWIGANQAKVDQILESYGVPLLDANGKVITGFRSGERGRGVPTGAPPG
jgi:quinoprotein dehydrogenase-associated probable ABC transporter substrate-binding protein